jgi:surface polysaccharide O-acyltransferase-like enzyme
MANDRIAPVDAARGCAMAMVCFSHIKQYIAAESADVSWLLAATTRIATPTFLLLSGFVIGHLLRTRERGTTSIALFDRALFLILLAHPLLSVAEIPEMGVAHWMFGRVMITDTIGIALLLALAIRSASAGMLFGAGISLCLLAWGVHFIPVSGPWIQNLATVLVDYRSTGPHMIEAPVIPYLGMFLIGMALSARFRDQLLQASHGEIARHLVRLSTAALIVVGVGVVVWMVAKAAISEFVGDAHVSALLRQTLDPRSKHPPSPAYFAFYGALGLLMLAWFFYGKPRSLVQPLIRHASVIGRASLMCYVVQDWIFSLAPALFGFESITSIAFWFVYLSVALLGLYVLSAKWEQAGGNRRLTVGIKAISRRLRQAGGSAAMDTLTGQVRRLRPTSEHGRHP